MVDLGAENIQFLLTLVDSLQVAKKENHVGVIATKAASTIRVKLKDPAGSEDETALLGYVRDAAKNGSFMSSSGDYEQSLTRAQELFTTRNGDRKTAQNVLLVVTDATNEFIRASAAADKINELKVRLKFQLCPTEIQPITMQFEEYREAATDIYKYQPSADLR